MKLPAGTTGTRAPRGGHACCRDCRAAIVWFRTDTGRNVSVDLKTCASTDRVLDLSRHTLHVNTCPERDKYRRKP